MRLNIYLFLLLQALEKEMADKRSELDKLNESGELLKKYGYEQIQPLLAVINTRWIELTTQFSQYRKVSLEKKTIVSSKAQQASIFHVIHMNSINSG